ncbi:MAG: ADP-ribosylglycohydrolase family protein, partial [Limisphaerales bacterium]
MNEIDEARRQGALWGGFVGDAHAMPAHWYYDRSALHRDYGHIVDYLAPRNPHPDSILWRSSYVAENERGQILHSQARFWGQRGVHYHQNLAAGENTLNLQLARLLLDSLQDNNGYDPDDYLARYLNFMLSPGSHRDTYLEEYHRNFFTNYARGKAPRKCGQPDIHIGGLAHVGVLCAYFHDDLSRAREVVREHVGLTHPAP